MPPRHSIILSKCRREEIRIREKGFLGLIPIKMQQVEIKNGSLVFYILALRGFGRFSQSDSKELDSFAKIE